MAEQALSGDWTVEIKFLLAVEPRRDSPSFEFCVPGSRRLKEPPPYVDQVASTVIAGTNEVVNAMACLQATLFQPVVHSCRIAGYLHAATRQGVPKCSAGLLVRPAQ